MKIKINQKSYGIEAKIYASIEEAKKIWGNNKPHTKTTNLGLDSINYHFPSKDELLKLLSERKTLLASDEAVCTVYIGEIGYNCETREYLYNRKESPYIGNSLRLRNHRI